MDPPYKEKELNNLLLDFINEKILNKNGIVILHRHKKHIDNLPVQFKILEEKNMVFQKFYFVIFFKLKFS